jgi:hypothetical protein
MPCLGLPIRDLDIQVSPGLGRPDIRLWDVPNSPLGHPSIPLERRLNLLYVAHWIALMPLTIFLLFLGLHSPALGHLGRDIQCQRMHRRGLTAWPWAIKIASMR